MRLPPDTTIAEDKLTRYLLMAQARGDKSAFLAQAGYGRQNMRHLLRDLRSTDTTVGGTTTGIEHVRPVL